MRRSVARIPGAASLYRYVQRTASWIRTLREYRRFGELSRQSMRPLRPRWGDRQFCTGNRERETPFDRHYVYHTAWAMRRLVAALPAEHVDISSSLYFVALASAIVRVRHFDYRPPALRLDNLDCGSADLLELPFESGSIRSLSCMHVIEHVGLGRYGDPLDAYGDVKSAGELQRVLAPGGRLFVVVPVGRSRVCFNAHRIYTFGMVCDLFPELVLEEHSLVPDDPGSDLVVNADSRLFDSQSYGCGCFLFARAHEEGAETALSTAIGEAR